MPQRRSHPSLIVLACARGCAVLGLGSVARADSFDPKTDPVFVKMVGVNAGLRSYKAHIEVETRVMLASFTLRGTIYDKNGRTKIAFDNLPALARLSAQNQPNIGAVVSWPATYAISIAARDRETTTYHLVPNAVDKVRSIDVVARNDSGLVQRYVWLNVNGLTIASDQSFITIGEYRMIGSSDTETHGRGLNTTSHAVFSNYEINSAVPESVFAPD
jgi:hypothetical protein